MTRHTRHSQCHTRCDAQFGDVKRHCHTRHSQFSIICVCAGARAGKVIYRKMGVTAVTGVTVTAIWRCNGQMGGCDSLGVTSAKSPFCEGVGKVIDA